MADQPLIEEVEKESETTDSEPVEEKQETESETESSTTTEERRPAVNLKDLLAQKAQEEKVDLTPAEELGGIEAILKGLNDQRQANEKAKALERSRKEAEASNLEILQSDIEEAYNSDEKEKHAQKSESTNSAEEEAKKRALRELKKDKLRNNKK